MNLGRMLERLELLCVGESPLISTERAAVSHVSRIYRRRGCDENMVPIKDVEAIEEIYREHYREPI